MPWASGGSDSHAYSNAWVGVGLGNSYTYPLVQGGSESDSGCGPSLGGPCTPWAWIEVWPWEAYERQISQLSSIGGDLLFVHVRFTHDAKTNDGRMLWHVVDMTKSIDLHFGETIHGTLPDGHAEFIAERPTVNGSLPPLADFGFVDFEAAQASAPTTGWKGVGNLYHYWYWMEGSTGHLLASPGAIDSTGYSFSVNWYGHN